MANPRRLIQNGGVRERGANFAGWLGQQRAPLLAGLGVLAVLFLVAAVFPPLLANAEDSENEVRATLLQALGGLVLLTGLFFTYRTFDLNRQGHELDRQAQFTERFTRAIDQLGNRESLDVRLGGIYALERVAWDSPRDHGPVMEVLTAYVRVHHSRESRGPPSKEEVRPGLIPADLQAALTALGRRNTAYEDPETSWDLGVTDLANAELINAKLAFVYFYRTNFWNAILSSSTLEAAFLKEALLQEAQMSQSNLRKANLTGASLQDANLVGANFQGANLMGADLREANLSDANFTEALINSSTQADVDLVALGAKLVSDD